MKVALLRRIEAVVLAIWIGSVWSIGLLATPVLFNTLSERSLAGNIAGTMLTYVSYLGLICGTLLWFCSWLPAEIRELTGRRRAVVLLMLVLVVIGQFVLHPMIAELRATGIAVGSATATQFARLHGFASLVYFTVGLLGLGLIWTQSTASNRSRE